MSGEETFLLPNGCTLRRGGRIRIPLRQLHEINQDDAARLGLRLGDDFSPASEVIEWPAATPTPSKED